MADVESPPVEAITEAPSVLNDTAEAAINGTTGKVRYTKTPFFFFFDFDGKISVTCFLEGNYWSASGQKLLKIVDTACCEKASWNELF